MRRIILASTFLSMFSACSGGGDSGPNVIVPTVTIQGPSNVASFSDCVGSSWKECVKLTPVPNDPQNRITNYSWEMSWTTANSDESKCEDFEVESPSTLVHWPYAESYSCDWALEYRYNDTDGQVTNYAYHTVGFSLSPSDFGIGSVFNGERLSGSLVFLDENENFRFDKGELSAISNFFGEFDLGTLKVISGRLIAMGGTGIDSGRDFSSSILAADSRIGSYGWITQLSTLEVLNQGDPGFERLLREKSAELGLDPEKAPNNLRLELEIRKLVEGADSKLDLERIYKLALKDLLD